MIVSNELNESIENKNTSSIIDEDYKVEYNELVNFVSDLQLKDEQKQKERNLNSISYLSKNPFDVSKLDSNIKKNAAFVKKLKTLPEPMKDGMLKDIKTLNLTKYLSEVVAALVELKLKTSEIPMYLQICVEIHRLYPEFHVLLLEQWQKNLPKTVHEITNFSKLRLDLRIFAELILIGIFSLKESLLTLGSLLKTLLSEKQSITLNVILYFCKNCGWDFANLIPKKLIDLSNKYKIDLPKSSFLNQDRQKNLRNLLKEYFNQICRQIEIDYKELKNLEFENKQLLITKGELSIKRKAKYEELKLNFQKTWSSLQQFSDLLNQDLPELPNEITELEECSNIDKKTMMNIDISNGIKINSINIPLWEDENVRSFYENLPNFKNEIPSHLYKDSIKEKYPKFKKDKSNERNENKFERFDKEPDKESKMIEKTEISDEILAKNLTKELINDESDDEGGNIEKELEKLQIDSDDEEFIYKKNKTNNSKFTRETKITLEELLSILLNCVTRDQIDKAAYNFCMNFNTKSNRKRLIRVLFTCPRTRLDLLPFYARFIAIVNPIMPLIGVDLVYLLKKDFRFHLKKKDQINIESKIKTVRYIGELTKFGIFPKDETLKCLKILLLDFSHHQIEMVCNLLEVCGRYLYLNSSTHLKCNLLFQQMLRKKTLIPMQTKYISMIENAYFNSCPNLNGNTQQNIQNDSCNLIELEEQLSDVQLYYRHLIQKELDKKNIEIVLNTLRKFNYNDKEFCSFAVKCLSEVWNIKYFNIKYLANCLAGLAIYQPTIIHQVVDSVLEEIRIMIEINSIRFKQRRISVIKYLGELYNYRLIESSVIIHVLYSMVSYGVNPNYETFNLVLKERIIKSLNSNSFAEENKINLNSHKMNNDDFFSQQKLSLTDSNQLNSQLLENGESDLDNVDSLIRIILICLLLDTTVPYINTSNGKKKLECFVIFFQLYYMRKKLLYTLQEDGNGEKSLFPVEIEYMFVDSMKKIQPKYKLPSNYCEAYCEMQKLIEKLYPYIIKLMRNPNNNSNHNIENNVNKNLNFIIEMDEDDESEADQDLEEHEIENYNDEDLDNESQNEYYEEDDINYDRQNKNDIFDEENLNDSQDSIEEKIEQALDLDDENFQKEFDKVISESISNRNNDNLRNINTDIVIPVSKLENLNKVIKEKNPSTIMSFDNNDLNNKEIENENKIFNVILMTKTKNNKQLLKKVQVPLNSKLAISLKEKKLAEREEKERVKKLTLDINERREMEDELLKRSTGILSLNLNRDNRRKYNHLKGVPDADIIFGYNRKK